ncbi:hypothetical protein AWB80_02075 [Caballeronia pedi]|uniref:DUF2214 domain-containing protein n=1 Tax=Caballeronia pedi TaxID=1777141 RepID=A0A158ADZ6_9BURK|nr:hypothetical protein [Caballeronia pedi]SAK55297.1 hypothetical protein AWB80_02075 [Caballeronia pedi]
MELASYAAALAASVEASALAMWLRGSAWGYPLVNLIHLLGLTLLIGPIGLLDLRLLGFGRRFSIADVSSVLTPYAVAGLVMLIGSGVLLFSADASPLHRNPLLQVKLGCILLGLANALAFRRIWAHRLADWDRRPPLSGRVQAFLSLMLWPIAGTLGRLLAYK